MKTALLMGLLMAVFLVAGRALGGQDGMIGAFVLAVLLNLGSWWFSDRIVLAMYGGQEVSAAQAPQLHAVIGDLARRADLPMPRVYLLPQAAPNAFATGRDPSHAAVAVTEGLVRMMPHDELRAVIAHELGHVRNRDTLISVVAATMAGALSMLASMARWGMLLGGRRDDRDRNPLVMLLTLILAPFAAMLIQLAISRSREFEADAWSAHLLGDGEPLARALRRLEQGVQFGPGAATPATAHLFIVNPFGDTGGMRSLFRTHPSTEERIRRLLAWTEAPRERRTG